MRALIAALSLFFILFCNSVSAEVEKGVDIKQVQTVLAKLCYEPGFVDGLWGRKTEAAVKAFFSRYNRMYRGKFDKNDENFVLTVGGGATSRGLVACKISEQTRQAPQNSTKSLTSKLNARKTINSFIPWTVYTEGRNGLTPLGHNQAQLFWTQQDQFDRDKKLSKNSRKANKTLLLVAANWMFERKFNETAELKEFYNSKALDIDEYKGQLDRYPINIKDLNYPSVLAEVLKKQMKQYQLNGVSFDWWHDDIERFQKGISKWQIKKIRLDIVENLREKIGSDQLIIGNTNYKADVSTHKHLNGIFMEVSSRGREYSSSEISKIESLMHRHNKYLQQPKMILLKVDKIYDPNQSFDWKHPKNRKAAKLFAAMSVVIPDNGYFLYEMGGKEMREKYPDIQASITFPYKFYDFDIGKPISGFKKVGSAAGYKEHEKGFVAYNAGFFNASFKYNTTFSVSIPPYSGLFCRELPAKLDCLPAD